MINRLFVEKRPGCDVQACSLTHDLRSYLKLEGLEAVRIIYRYDIQDIDQNLLEQCKPSVFSEPPVDLLYEHDFPLADNEQVFAIESLAGQFDQRSDSCEQCIQLIGCCDRPKVRTATLYALTGKLSDDDIVQIKKYLINPVETRQASLDLPDTLDLAVVQDESITVLEGFLHLQDEELAQYIRDMGLAMDSADLALLRDYFSQIGRNPTLTELKVVDTYWSDHCRHTTFQTCLDTVTFEDLQVQESWERYLRTKQELGNTKAPTLMDIATIASKFLQRNNIVKQVDVSDEINACTVKITVDVDGKDEDWLLLFKNETHNHPTEIEPFGGAATCIGGAIRDPLSGRSYVYQAMRLSGSADPRTPLDQTRHGKLSQRQIALGSAAGNSSYGNQIGLATGLVEEIYHPGYLAKHMELGAVIGAVPSKQVRRETPQAGDVVVLLGGKTGRDGCGGATGSSKSHDTASLSQCGAEVQKGNAPQERKLQRLFRNPKASKEIKRCNDFGAGGVCVAIGELAPGLKIDLDAVPLKYEGLGCTEIAISESQERMAVVLDKQDVQGFIDLAHHENLEATIVATITDDDKLVMTYRGKTVVDLDRSFLDTNGAQKHVKAHVTSPTTYQHPMENSIELQLESCMKDLNVCSKQGLSERFDSTIGANTVLMPFGGTYQKTPPQAMVALLPVPDGTTNTCSVMAYGYDPYISEANPYQGAYLAVVHSLAKLAATGADPSKAYLTFQEYFGRTGQDPLRWGKPLSALLGAFDAQMDFQVAAIGGKDSMSGSFEDLDVPNTLVSFAVATEQVQNITGNEFKRPGSHLVLLAPEYVKGLPTSTSVKTCFTTCKDLIHSGKAVAAWALGRFGLAEAIAKMSFGNRIGIALNDNCTHELLFKPQHGAILLEVTESMEFGLEIGTTTSSWKLVSQSLDIDLKLEQVQNWYEEPLEEVYPTQAAKQELHSISPLSYPSINHNRHSRTTTTRPKVIIPVFPGTNCEYDSARMFERVGASTQILVLNNMDAASVQQSALALAQGIKESQILFVPGGFSGGDEPDGSGKFIASFLRNNMIADSIQDLLDNRDGLILGICNGFQALIKLGLLPYGQIQDIKEDDPTLTYNTINRHQSSLVRTRVCCTNSPWFMHYEVGDSQVLPISHGEGRFICDDGMLNELVSNGQVATQYVDFNNKPTMDITVNPNGSTCCIEGITSKNGRILGRMAHAERTQTTIYKNTDFIYDDRMFRGAIDYFK